MIKHKKTRNWAFIIIVFFIAITAIRMLWMNFLTTFDYSQNTIAKQGVLDLRGWAFSSTQTLPLNGEWEFFPSAFISPEEFEEDRELSKYEKVNLSIPGTWDKVFVNKEKDSFRFGTYRLRILLDPGHTQLFGLRVNEIRSASYVYVNGQLTAGVGQPSTEFDKYQAQNIPYSVKVQPNDNEIDLIIHVSNHTYGGKGGVTKPIRFGTLDAIHLRTTLSIGLQLLLVVVLLVHGLYALLLFFLGGKNKGLLYFFLLISFAILSVLVSDDKLLSVWLKLPHEWSMKSIYFSYIGVSLFIPFTIKYMFPVSVNPRILRWFAYYCGIFTLLILLVPYSYNEKMARIMLLTVLLLFVAISVTIFSRALKNTADLIFLLISSLSIGINVMWVTIFNRAGLEWIHYPFDLIISVLSFSAFWFRRFFWATAETKQLAKRLQIENDKKDEFLINASHELRNPLHGITNMTQSILDDPVNLTSHEHRNRLDILMKVSKHMSFLLDDLLDITRLKEKTVQLQLTKTSVQSIVIGVADMVRYMLDGKPIRLEVKIPDSFPAVQADENRLIQILYNLIHNAVKYTDEGSVIIHGDHNHEMARIHVEDTGIGMEEEALQGIFQPYEQADNNASRASAGFGLGLSICKQLVELHGGTLTVNSAMGKGSVFTFTLPLFKNQHKEKDDFPITYVPIEKMPGAIERLESLPKANISSKVKPSILVADDDSVNLRVLHHLLEVENYEITAVTNAEQALEQLKLKRFDLVILDVMMPRMSGYELTRLIRERFTISELPVLLLTARGRSEDILAGFQSGANDYVKKPIDARELKARVHALTDLKLSIEEQLRMEGAWLQSQIQPHFIYNTLNSIVALGVMDIPKMQALFEEFSNYLRLSFDFKNSEPVVSIEHELSLVQSYLYIEKERFGDRLMVQWEAESYTNFELPPLSIQPLVENAINHGILQRRRGGTVNIRIQQHANHIEISIIDDGIGMTKEELEQLFMKINGTVKKKGIGIRNIDRRLKQLYGRGLTIQSIPEQGTTVSFQIPLENK
ncbi:sensor histidine kinase YesM [Cytobacillus eiseniae]|uniref:histidine kinase n=1 Tax=Cytobacillus eiseniae TaxID=762947 RepID=A0ABS4RFA2_9BACI|nr:ATP-binding protein [Cytobacillus eiseniae]MBP2241580.1 sensor histidine kinase YesM [Cytobacillus eiseniae]